MRNTLIATLLAPGLLLAQESPTSSGSNPDAPAPTLHGRLGIDFTSQYFFRGIVQDKGFIAQPWIEVGYDLYDGNDTLRDLRLVLGQWNSMGDGPNGSQSGLWYESRFYAGLMAQIGERWHVGGGWISYEFPSVPVLNANGLSPVQEVAFLARFDDKGVFSDEFSLQPYGMLAFEIANQRDFGNDRGVYAEVGVAPEFAVGQVGQTDVTLRLPAKIGMSFGDYYERFGGGNDEFFGFLQAGAVLEAPLNYLPARLGPWVADVGLHLILLGDNNEARNNGDTAELLLTLGLSTRF